MKSCTAQAVNRTICRLTNLGENTRVKRKYKTNGNKTRWWFVVHANSEEQMISLESQWESVEAQTMWKLEACTKPCDDAPTSATPQAPSHPLPPPTSENLEEDAQSSRTPDFFSTSPTSQLLSSSSIRLSKSATRLSGLSPAVTPAPTTHDPTPLHQSSADPVTPHSD